MSAGGSQQSTNPARQGQHPGIMLSYALGGKERQRLACKSSSWLLRKGFNSGVRWNSHVSKLNLWLGKLQTVKKLQQCLRQRSNNAQTLELFCSNNE